MAVALMVGCAQQVGSLSSNDNAAAARPLPFDRTPDSTGLPATAELAHSAIPAGTTLVIRLQSPISSVSAHIGESFEGVLDEPVLVANRTALPNGTVVRGTVLDAKPGEPNEAGYVRIMLSSILVDNKPLDIHTSSLFAKGSLPGAEKTGARRSRPTLETVSSQPSLEAAIHAQGDVKFSTARRLIFRLLKPVLLPN